MPPLQPHESLAHYLLRTLAIAPFMRPFYYLLVLSIDVGEPRRTEAEVEFERVVTTSWGGGKLANLLLFDGDHVLPS